MSDKAPDKICIGGREVDASLQDFDFGYYEPQSRMISRIDRGQTEVEGKLTLTDLDEMFEELVRTTGAFGGSYLFITKSTAKRIRRLLAPSEKKRLLHQKRFPHLTKREFERILIK